MDDGDCMDVLQKRKWPFLKLSMQINKNKSRIARNKDVELIFSGLFDCYLLNIVAPDHLISGLTKGLVECCFHEIKTSVSRV